MPFRWSGMHMEKTTNLLIIGAGPGLGISLYGRDHAPGLLVYNASQ